MTLLTRITSAAMALALAIGVVATSAAPARASDDAAKLLFGAAALAIIAGAVHAETRHRAAPQPQYHQPHPRAQPKRHNRAIVLPGRCEVALQSAGKTRHGYRERCLRRAGVTHLPSQCVVGHWKGAVYGARCLDRHGYVRG